MMRTIRLLALCTWLSFPGLVSAQSAPRPSFEQARALVARTSVDELKTTMFPVGGPESYVRAEAIPFTPSPWATVWLTGRPEALFPNGGAYVAGLCRIQTAQALLQTLEPLSFLNPRTETRYKAVPKAALGLQGLQAYCDTLPTLSFDAVNASDTEFYAIEAVYRLIDHPEAADIVNEGCVPPNTGVLCGLTAEGLRTAMSVQSGPCIGFFAPFRRTPAVTARFKEGWCFQVSGGGRIGFGLLIEAGVEKPKVQFRQGVVVS